MSFDYEYRVFNRVFADVLATITLPSGEVVEALSPDMSFGGMRIESATIIPLGTGVSVSFFTDKFRSVEAQGLVSWTGDGFFGIRFTRFDSASFDVFTAFLLELSAKYHELDDQLKLHVEHLPEIE